MLHTNLKEDDLRALLLEVLQVLDTTIAAMQSLRQRLEQGVKGGLQCTAERSDQAPTLAADPRRKPRSRIAKHPDIEQFIMAPITKLTFAEVVAEVAASFPAERHVSMSALYRWWHRTGRALIASTVPS